MSDATAIAEITDVLSDEGFHPTWGGSGASARRSGRPGSRRGSPLQAAANELETVQLIDEGDVLRWDFGDDTFRTIRRARDRDRARRNLAPSQVVRQLEFAKIEGSQIATLLAELDHKLTPAHAGDFNGLRQVNVDGRLAPPPSNNDLVGKKVFLLIHGTFSNTENVLGALNKDTNAAGKALLGALLRREGGAGVNYDYVLTFDHPTLGVSPFLNAFDLAAQLRAELRQLDIVCHSRGGLVTRWYCEALSPQTFPRNAVLVGAPLGGTSLAAAPKLRRTCDYLSNLVGKLEKLASWFSGAIIRVIGILLKLIRWALTAAARTPLFDAAVAVVPGLDGQSRIGNNEEIRRLRRNTGSFQSDLIRYHAVTADFEPPSEGWKFWRYFTHKPGQRLLNAGADLIFENQDMGSRTACQNDLIVNTDSMTELADQRYIQSVHAFGTQSDVHHTNYFQHPDTIDFIRRMLRIT